MERKRKHWPYQILTVTMTVIGGNDSDGDSDSGGDSGGCSIIGTSRTPGQAGDMPGRQMDAV